VTDAGAKFRVNATFELSSRQVLMVVCEVVSGTVRPGDRASRPGAEFVVSAVEMLTYPDRRCDIALGFRYADDEVLTQLKAFAETAAVLNLLPRVE
jgi:hypothetical protein